MALATDLPTPEQFQAVRDPVLTVPGLREDTELSPYPYQLTDAAYLCAYQRALLAEYPAAGKKIIAILAILKLFALMKAQNALILSLGTDVTQWIEEFDKWTDGITVQHYAGPPKHRAYLLEQEADIRCATYQAARNDLPKLLNRHSILVADEVSILKNTETDLHPHIRCLFAPTSDDQLQAWTAIQDNMQKAAEEKDRPFSRSPFPSNNRPPAEYAFGLTATPYETGPADIFSLFWLLQGSASVLGNNPTRFENTCCVVETPTIKVPKYKKGKKVGLRKMKIRKVKGLKPEVVPMVSDRIKNYYMRHPWDVVAEFLPDLHVEPKWLEFGSRQRKRYEEIAAGDVIADMIFMERGRRIDKKQVSHAIQQFYQLRCCDGLNSLPGQKFSDSVKLNECMKLLEHEFGREKVVIYSRFHQPLDDLEKKLDGEGFTHTRIDGNRTDEENDANRIAFQSPDGPQVLLITGKGGYALNLHVARFGIAFNTLWNPAKIKQLHGRTRRRGHHDSVLWYHLLVKDTVEEYLWTVLRDRAHESDELIPDVDVDLFDDLTPEEQDEALRHGHGKI